VDNIGYAANEIVTLSGGPSSLITGLSPQPITWQPSFGSKTGGVTALTLKAGSGGGFYTIQGAAPMPGSIDLVTGAGVNIVNIKSTAAPVNVKGTTGKDLVDLGGGNVDGISGNVSVSNNTGTTTVVLDDSSNTLAKTNVAMTSVVALKYPSHPSTTTVTGLAPAKVTLYSDHGGTTGVTGLSIFGGKGGNTFLADTLGPFSSPVSLNTGAGSDHVYILATNAPFNLDGGGGSDAVVLGHDDRTLSLSYDLSRFNGVLTVSNTGGQTALTAKDLTDTTARNAVLTSGQIAGLAPATIAYTPGQVASMLIDGGRAANTFNVQGTPLGTTTTIDGGAFDDTINLGNAVHGLGDLLGPITFNGAAGNNTLNLADNASATDRRYTLNSTTVVVLGLPMIGFTGVSAMNLNLSNGNDLAAIGLSPPTFPIHLFGGKGNSTLIGANVPNTWTISGPNSGSLNNVVFTGIPNLHGGRDNDVFTMLPAGSLTGNLDGGGPNFPGRFDWLDSSAFTTPVTVDLTKGSATNVHGQVISVQGVRGGSGVDTLTGGIPPCVLVGGAANDLLRAGSGRAILIGGNGADILVGGTDETILIGGRTAFDANITALDVILQEWSLTSKNGKPYLIADRAAAIRAGVGPGGVYKLNSTTVIDDQAVDQLLTGPANVWFWATTQDKKTKRANDMLN
jgi:hypothetical protein